MISHTVSGKSMVVSFPTFSMNGPCPTIPAFPPPNQADFANSRAVPLIHYKARRKFPHLSPIYTIASIALDSDTTLNKEIPGCLDFRRVLQAMAD
jgi:hypothetical protein